MSAGRPTSNGHSISAQTSQKGIECTKAKEHSRSYCPDIYYIYILCHRAIVALVKEIQGPQDVILELRMDMYHLGKYQASAVAQLFLYITPYHF